MTWLLTLLGLALLLLGLWGGPEPSQKRSARAEPPEDQDEPWQVLAQPLKRDELIEIPSESPWNIFGGDRRFRQGLFTGLGSGLLIAALLVVWLPQVAFNPVVVGGDAVEPIAADPPAADPPASQPPATPPPVNQPPAQPPVAASVAFDVIPGDLPHEIATRLKAKGLIASEQAFLVRIAELGLDTQLRVGRFEIPTAASLDQVITLLTS